MEPVGIMKFHRLILNLDLQGSFVPELYKQILPGLVCALATLIVAASPICARQIADPTLLQAIPTESVLPQETSSTPKYDFAPPINGPQRPVPTQLENSIGSDMTGVTPRDSSGGQLGGFVIPLNQQDEFGFSLDDKPGNRRLPAGEKRLNETSGRVEVIRERYPDGKVQIMRQVTQDKDRNYFNHGTWQLFNRRGEVMGEGEYYLGRMEGQWKRWHPSNGAGLFSTPPFNQFQGPYLSTSEFSDGKLNGVWTIADRGKSPIFEVSYQDGVRHGTATWYHTNGSKMRECVFREGVLDGPLFEWDTNNKVLRKEEYIQGRRIISDVQYATKRQKLSESFYLAPKLELEGEDSWWEAKPANFVTSGERIQHGPTGSWYSNGQPKMQGQFDSGKRSGTFVGWHANGQKDVIGQFDEGKKVDNWVWWHANGQKRIEGQYQNNIPVGTWTWWDEDGSVRKQQDLSANSILEDGQKETDGTESGEQNQEETGPEEIEAEEIPAEELPPKANNTDRNDPPDSIDIPDDVIPYETRRPVFDPIENDNESKKPSPQEDPFDESHLDDESRWMDMDVLGDPSESEGPRESVEVIEGNLQRNLDADGIEAIPTSDEDRQPLAPPLPIEDPFADNGTRQS